MQIKAEDVRSSLVVMSKYSRVKDDGTFENYDEIVDRVVYNHQKWLWERQLNRQLNKVEMDELDDLRNSMLSREQTSSGRTLYLGGTELSKKAETTQFNCAFTNVRTVKDVVDVFWLLLNGCGVGVKPRIGLTGFFKPLEVEIIDSTREHADGRQNNVETVKDGVWTISVGDSAESWAKFIGKILAHPYNDVYKIVLDFSEIRPAGIRLSRYGWISSGHVPLRDASIKIVDILNRKSGCHLTKIDILDVICLIGTTLSSRRSALMVLMDYDDPEWHSFSCAKNDLNKHPHRTQSNNSTLFNRKPSKEELKDVFDLMIKNGGSEPAIINVMAAKLRAPYFEGTNPCGEVLLTSKSMCNLWEVNMAAFVDREYDLLRVIRLAARANYRQTLVNLNDGILQEEWDRNNKFLRLCGLGLTGIQINEMQPHFYKRMERMAVLGFHSMAEELGLNECKNGTTIKPSGTLSKGPFKGVTEGIHSAQGEYIFNNINFGLNDPILPILKNAGFYSFENPYDPNGVIVRFPQDNSKWNLKPITQQSAVEQLNRYKLLMDNYCHQNVSCTIAYSLDEVDEIQEWLLTNWDTFVAVAWMIKEDAGEVKYKYLPQEVVSKQVFDDYVSLLRPIDIDGIVDTATASTLSTQECSGGSCPVN